MFCNGPILTMNIKNNIVIETYMYIDLKCIYVYTELTTRFQQQATGTTTQQ